VRIKVSLLAKKGEIVDFNHCRDLSRVIREAIRTSNPEIFSDPSSELYTFSRLLVKNRMFRITREGMKLLTNQLHFFFSSASNEVCKSLVEGLVELEEVSIRDVVLEVSGVEIIRESRISSREKFVTLSPINAGTNFKRPDFEETFTKDIFKELKKRFELLTGESADGMSFKARILKLKPVRIKLDWGYLRAYLMVFNAEGSENLLRIGYTTGFGKMTDMGFGMVKTTLGNPKTDNA